MRRTVKRAMRRVLVALLWALVAAASSGMAADEAATEAESAAVDVPALGGAVWAADQTTLIATAPASGKLVYIDTVLGEQTKEVDVDFQPEHLAIQGNQLFVSAKGAPVIHVLDAQTGAAKSEIQLQGEAIRALACGPKSGMLYAANKQEEIWSIDPAKNKSFKTKARGMFLAVDPTNGTTLFTGTNRPSQEFVEVQRAGKTARVRLVIVAERATILKYQAAGANLKLVGGNTNAAIGAGGHLTVSPDGKRVSLAAGGGWRSLTETRAHYVIVVFDAKDPEKTLGQVETDAYPQCIAFHPVLNLGAAARHDGAVKLFKASSLVDVEKYRLGDPKSLDDELRFISFGGKGTRLVYYRDQKLHIEPIPLAAADVAQLTKAYGKLPAVAKAAAAEKEGSKSADSKSPGKGAKPLVEVIEDRLDDLLEPAKEGAEYLTDQTDLKITKLPMELAGTAMLVRATGDKMRWIDFPQWYRVNRACTVYVALVTEDNGFRRVSKADYQRLLKEGWTETDMEFATGHDRVEDWKPTWKVLSRKVKAGPLAIESKIDVSSSEVIFFFK